MARTKVFSWTPKYYFQDANGNTFAFLRKKLLTWKDEIRLFTDESQSMELLFIKARKIIDWGTAFDVTDSLNHQKVGAVKRKGWKSLFRSEWIIMDANDQEIGKIKESSAFAATIHRFIKFIPQQFTFYLGDRQIGTVKQNWNLFAPKMDVDFSEDPGRSLDRRLGAAAVILLLAVETREQQN